jgi:hypothetical protein
MRSFRSWAPDDLSTCAGPIRGAGSRRRRYRTAKRNGRWAARGALLRDGSAEGVARASLLCISLLLPGPQAHGRAAAIASNSRSSPVGSAAPFNCCSGFSSPMSPLTALQCTTIETRLKGPGRRLRRTRTLYDACRPLWRRRWLPLPLHQTARPPDGRDLLDGLSNRPKVSRQGI